MATGLIGTVSASPVQTNTVQTVAHTAAQQPPKTYTAQSNPTSSVNTAMAQTQPAGTAPPVATTQPVATMHPTAQTDPLTAVAHQQSSLSAQTTGPSATATGPAAATATGPSAPATGPSAAAAPATVSPHGVSTVAAPTNTPRQVAGSETVAGQLNSLLNQNSAYMQSARNSALEQANSRGLINSSLAVGTAQRAAIDSAMPIAQQDANTYANSAQSAQEANQNLRLSGYNAQLNSQQAKENFGYNSQLQSQQNEANSRLAEQNAKATSDLQTKLKQMDINLDLSKMGSQEKQNFTSAASPIIQQFESEIATIQRTPDEQMSPADKQRAINYLNQQLQSRLKTMGSIYGFQMSWTGPTASGAPAPTQNPAPSSSAPPQPGNPPSNYPGEETGGVSA